MTSYWSVVKLESSQRAKLALHYLALNGFETYYPKIRETRIHFGRRVGFLVPLFPGYCFALIKLQWHQINRTPGTRGLIMDGGLTPAKVPNAVISEIRDREVDGLVQLVQPDQLQPGDPVRIARGPLMGQLGIYAGMSSAQRVQVLFMLLAGQRKVTLALDDIESATL